MSSDTVPHTTEAGVPALTLRTDAPPEDGSQILAWAIAQHGHGHATPGHPRWVIAQFVPAYRGGTPYWCWSTPGRATNVEVIAWMPLPKSDAYAQYAREIVA